MNTESLAEIFLWELEQEAPASRKCIERVPEKLFNWKPHDKSMNMGYLAVLVAEIPKWITLMTEQSEIDFVNFERFSPKTTDDLVKRLDENLAKTKEVLSKTSNEGFSELCYLKRDGKVLFSVPKSENVVSTLNHWVHHRGQLTVYLRLNNIAVPSIYGPSADEGAF